MTAGVHCGIKKKKPDLAIIYSEKPCVAAGAFTKNSFKAAPVILSSKRIKNKIRAIVINSGNANACTGKQGYQDAIEMAKFTAKVLNVPENSVLVASTGVIGQRLPINKIKSGIKKAAKLLSPDDDVAPMAILTTDTKTKVFHAEKHGIKIGAMAKGSGMIQPSMATMLAFITTNFNTSRKVLQSFLKQAVEKSFNSITVDGDTSTNDMVILLSNRTFPEKPAISSSLLYTFKELLEETTLKLALSMVKDGEGATKLITVEVRGCKTKKMAQQIAFSIANSPLVKTAMGAGDPNWGRILAAAGKKDYILNPQKVCLWIQGTCVFKNGEPVKFSEKRLSAKMNGDVHIVIDLGYGKNSWKVYTCDLTCEYVKINRSYRT